MKKTIFILLLLLITISVANANSTPAVSWTELLHSETWPLVTLGYSFTVGNIPVVVTDLGYYDENGDGLQKDHLVGIWDNSGNLLGSTTVLAGNKNLDGKYRYQSLSKSIILETNTTYVIGGQANYEAVGRSGIIKGLEINPLLSSLGTKSLYTYGAALNLPTKNHWEGPIYAGPNFKLEAVPEPSTLLGFGTALMVGAPGMVGWIRRRRS